MEAISNKVLPYLRGKLIGDSGQEGATGKAKKVA